MRKIHLSWRLLMTVVLFSLLVLPWAIDTRSAQATHGPTHCGAAIADLWFGNDESGSVSADEFEDALDFMYLISDEYNYDAVTGVQGGAFAWWTTTADAVIPISEDFGDPDDSGLLQDANVVTDGDSTGIRELYPARQGSGGTDLTLATQHMADLIDAGNGRRAGVLQVGIILTDATEAQLTGDSVNWIAAADNLRSAGEGDIGIVLVLIAEAATAYDSGTAGPTVDSVAGTEGLVVTVPTYADAADPTAGYVDLVVDAICEKATPDVDPALEKAAVFNDENGDSLPQAGETITYTYTVTNPAETDLIDISINEEAGTFDGNGVIPTPTYVSGDEDVDGDGDAPDLAFGSPGSVVFTADYTLTQADIDQGSVTNQASVDAVDTLGNSGTDLSDDPNDLSDVDSESDGEPDDPTVTSLAQSAEIQLTKTGSMDGLPLAGQTVSYEFTVKNTGNVTLSDISISDAKVVVSGGPLASLAPGATDSTTFTASYTLTQLDVDTGWVENTATADAEDPDTNPVTDTSDAGSESIETPDGDGDTNADPTDDPTVVSLLDQDNISDEEEDGGPNSGDGNSDGIADSIQSYVTTAMNPVIKAYTTTAISGDCVIINSVDFFHEPDLDVADPEFDYPLGLHGFEVECTGVGDTVDITYYWDQEYDTSGWTYRKYNPASSSYADFTDHVTFGTANIGGSTVTTVSYSVTDGGPFDGDGLADGSILDPVGPTYELVDTGDQAMVYPIIGLTLVISATAVSTLPRKQHNGGSGT